MQAFAIQRLGAALACVLLALPLMLGWHPTPTLGSLADALAAFSTAAILAFTPTPKHLNTRQFWLGTGGILFLFLISSVFQAFSGGVAYNGFWVGPMATLGTAFVISLYWDERAQSWLKVVAYAILLAAWVNALVGVLQFWRVSVVLDALEPYWVYWDRSDAVAHGNIAQRNNLATLCLLGMAASLFLFPKRGPRVLALDVFLAYVVALTASRTPLLIGLAVVLLTLIRERTWRIGRVPMIQRFVLPLLIVQILTPALNSLLQIAIELPPLESAVQRLSAQGLGIRVVYYSLAADIGWQAGPLGLGWKTFGPAMIDEGLRQGLWGQSDLPMHAHNILLHLWVENGLFLAALASFYPFWLLLRKGVTTPSGDLARLSVTVLVVHSWLEFPLWTPSFLFLFVVMMRTLENDSFTMRQLPALWRWSSRTIVAGIAIGAAVTTLQFVIVANSWKNLTEGRPVLAQEQMALLQLNPVIAPYLDWLTLNINRDSPAQRVQRLERLARWIPDDHMQSLLSQAYRSVGRHKEADRVDAQLRVVFGVGSDNTQ